MCKVKTGAEVCNWQDVQNLVTGIIFRQIGGFQRDDLIFAVNHYLNGSPMQNYNSKVENVIDSTLSLCVCSDWLLRQGNTYSPDKIPFLGPASQFKIPDSTTESECMV